MKRRERKSKKNQIFILPPINKKALEFEFDKPNSAGEYSGLLPPPMLTESEVLSKSVMRPILVKREHLIGVDGKPPAWLDPPHQREFRLTGDSRILRETFENEIATGMTPVLSSAILVGVCKEFPGYLFINDGNHRMHVIRLLFQNYPELKHVVVNVVFQYYPDMVWAAKHYNLLKKPLAAHHPNHSLKSLSKVYPNLEELSQLKYITFTRITESKNVSMQHVLQAWYSASKTHPIPVSLSVDQEAADLKKEDVKQLTYLLNTLQALWGKHTSTSLWSRPNLTMVFWFYRQKVLSGILSMEDFESSLVKMRGQSFFMSVSKNINSLEDRVGCYDFMVEAISEHLLSLRVSTSKGAKAKYQKKEVQLLFKQPGWVADYYKDKGINAH